MMADGKLIQDYVAFGSGPPATPSLGSNVAEGARYYDKTNYQEYAWYGTAWEPVGASRLGWHPWSTPNASDWRASAGATPGAWTLASGLAANYSHPVGLAKITWTDDTTQRTAVAAAAHTSEMDFVCRVALDVPAVTTKVAIGFSAAGNASDLDGISIDPNGAIHTLIAGSDVGGSGSGLFGIPYPWIWLWGKLAGGNFDTYLSLDGLHYLHLRHDASALTAAYAVIAVTPASMTGDVEDVLWLDFLVFGSSTPAGQ